MKITEQVQLLTHMHMHMGAYGVMCMHTHTISVCIHDHARPMHAPLVAYERATSPTKRVVSEKLMIERVMKSMVCLSFEKLV